MWRSKGILAFCLVVPAMAASAQSARQGATMHATGTFEVKVKPADASEIGKEAGLGRMTIDKVWSGGITGTSKGEMTTTAVDGALGYVALEKMTVSVDGHAGSFYFIHRAAMLAADPAGAVMDINVMPNSGTGDLKGIAGKLNIVIDKGVHSYAFDYTLPSR